MKKIIKVLLFVAMSLVSTFGIADNLMLREGADSTLTQKSSKFEGQILLAGRGPAIVGANCPSSTSSWGSCRDCCYNARRSCFNIGTETEACEAGYDNCAAACDRKF